MIVYSLIMFAVSAVFVIMGLKIYNGNTGLIHAYHQEKVTDKAGYARAFGKAMFVTAAGPLISGIIALFGESDALAMVAVAVLIFGLVIGLTCIVRVQIRYNRGIF